MGRFERTLMTDVSGIETLPLLHTCDAYTFRDIVESMSLTPQMCDVFNIDLLYTYYGLPSYRLNNPKATSNPAFYTICLILNSNEFTRFHKIFPFDSGAFLKLNELKDEFFHPKTKIDDFELVADIASAKKVVKTFYETNVNYLSEKPTVTKSFSMLDFEARSYQELINNTLNNSIDNRASTIEIIFDNRIELNSNTVSQIIIPNCFKDDKEVMMLLNHNLGIDQPLVYDTFRGTPKEYFGMIRSLYLNFLNSKE